MSFKRISIDEAKALIDQGNVTLADVRDAGAYLVVDDLMETQRIIDVVFD